MRKEIFVTAVLAVACLVSAQERRGVGIIPASGLERPEDVGVRMHTNYRIYAPNGPLKALATPAGETPASLACVYNLVSNPVSG